MRENEETEQMQRTERTAGSLEWKPQWKSQFHTGFRVAVAPVLPSLQYRFSWRFLQKLPTSHTPWLVNLLDISTDVCSSCYVYLYGHERSVSNITPTEELQQLNFPSRILQYKSQSCASPLPSPNQKWPLSKVRAGSAIQKKQRMHFVHFTGVNLWTNKQLLKSHHSQKQSYNASLPEKRQKFLTRR